MEDRYLCVYGHFYQPPRENPWLEAIEQQDSAYPQHDWNERVTDECYRPNARSRILDGEGRIVSIRNNYSRIGFDFGPTLLSWLDVHVPAVYRSVLEADRMSQARFSGHGSALAQAYNHMIMPLANERDRRTQVLWGIRDFELRFERKPEGMWLPETAADLATLGLLAEHGIRFTILAPRQAKRVRVLPEGEWRELSGDVDPSVPYVVRLPGGKSIVVFFYDGPISRAVAFEGLLRSGRVFAERLATGFSAERPPGQLMHIATDGETYGHHHPGGDMALAYALDYVEQEGLARITNYGEYLEIHPPAHEAEIHEASSWSCVHGVERWKADCGCNSGGHPGWNQRWRADLRSALDWLRDEIGPRFTEVGGRVFTDPWGARDAYIDVIENRGTENVERFLKEHAPAAASDADKVVALQLMELGRHAMLMYTSCGWFFDELSGLETVQVISYAARVVQLAGVALGVDLESPFLDRLQKAKSNVPEHGDGRRIYQTLVRPAMVDLVRVGAHYAVSSLFEEYGDVAEIYSYRVRRNEGRISSAGRARFSTGRAELTSIVTGESDIVAFAVLHLGDHVMSGGVKRLADGGEYDEMVQRAEAKFERAEFTAVFRIIDSFFGEGRYSLASLFRDEQRKVARLVLESTLQDVEESYRRVYELHAPLLRFLSSLNIPAPAAMRAASELVLNADLRDSAAEDPPDVDRMRALIDEARAQSVDPDVVTISYTLERSLNWLSHQMLTEPEDEAVLERIRDLVGFVREVPLRVDLSDAQNAWYMLRRQVYPRLRTSAGADGAGSSSWVELFLDLGDVLGFVPTEG